MGLGHRSRPLVDPCLPERKWSNARHVVGRRCHAELVDVVHGILGAV